MGRPLKDLSLSQLIELLRNYGDEIAINEAIERLIEMDHHLHPKVDETRDIS